MDGHQALRTHETLGLCSILSARKATVQCPGRSRGAFDSLLCGSIGLYLYTFTDLKVSTVLAEINTYEFIA